MVAGVRAARGRGEGGSAGGEDAECGVQMRGGDGGEGEEGEGAGEKGEEGMPFSMADGGGVRVAREVVV